MSVLLSLNNSTTACYHMAGRMVSQDARQNVGFEVAVEPEQTPSMSIHH
jgi:hypothetical protein